MSKVVCAHSGSSLSKPAKAAHCCLGELSSAREASGRGSHFLLTQQFSPIVDMAGSCIYSYHGHQHCKWRNYCHHSPLGCLHLLDQLDEERHGEMCVCACVLVRARVHACTCFLVVGSRLLCIQVAHLEKRFKASWNTELHFVLLLPST